jgi:hypothetical protein
MTQNSAPSKPTRDFRAAPCYTRSDMSDIVRHLDVLRTLAGHPRTATALAAALREHRSVEKEFCDRARQLSAAPDDLSFPHVNLPPRRYFERNFFSILFASIYAALDIPREKRRAYVLVTHAVRGIVTAADNILDNESKGAVKLEMPGAIVLPNILLVMLQHAIIHDALLELAPQTATRRCIWRDLMAAMQAIAQRESEEESRITTVLPPHRVLSQVHRFRGGQLLELAFIVPQACEPERRDAIGVARAAVHRIGLALQTLDDVTDLVEDACGGNHNILHSWIAAAAGHDADPIATRGTDAASWQGFRAEVDFPVATSQVLALAVELAHLGFDALHAVGYPISRSGARELLGTLFRLRGLGDLWAFHTAHADALDCDAARQSLAAVADYLDER